MCTAFVVVLIGVTITGAEVVEFGFVLYAVELVEARDEDDASTFVGNISNIAFRAHPYI